MRAIFVRCLVLMMIFSAVRCDVQKRRYQKGFYVSGHSKNKKTISPTESARQTDNKNKSANVIDHTIPALTGDVKTIASIKDPAVPNSKKLPLIGFATSTDSCDVLIFKDGSEIRAKVMEVGTSEIRYKRCDNRDGPTYVTKKSDLFLITYANGTRELIKADPEESRPLPTAPSTYTLKKNSRVMQPFAPFALVFGILGIVYPYIILMMELFSFGGIVIPPIYLFLMVLIPLLALIFGRIAISETSARPETYKGKGMAITGFIMGLAVLCILALIALIVVLSVI
jgi:hypothetical protein